MSFGIIGRKIGMTQFITEDGVVIPVTVVKAGPCVVVQVKTEERDGYSALQMGFEEKKESRVNKPMRGHFARSGVRAMKILREFRTPVGDYKVGDVIRCNIFSEGEKVDVVGITKGRGFAGGIKRHGWKGGEASHGSMFHRAPGSIGASASPSKVFKGHAMPGHYGAKRQTVLNLSLVKILEDEDIILLKGAVPGPNKGIVCIYKNRLERGKVPKKVVEKVDKKEEKAEITTEVEQGAEGRVEEACVETEDTKNEDVKVEDIKEKEEITGGADKSNREEGVSEHGDRAEGEGEKGNVDDGGKGEKNK